MKKFFRNFMVACAAAIMLACTLSLAGCGGLDWPSGPLAQLIPEAKGAKVTYVFSDSDTSLSFEMEIDKDDYNDFIAGVKDAGFTVESSLTGSSYSAFDANGNDFSASFYEYMDEAHVSIDAPTKLSAISWPSSELAQMLPTPEFTNGKVETDRTNYFSILIEMSKDNYAKYVDKLMESGFSYDYNKQEKTFSACNEDAYKVTCNYLGNSRVRIKVEPLVEEDETKSTTEAATTATTTAASTGDTDLRELADDYEDLVDRYIAFMEDYDPTDYSKLSEYTDLVLEYTEFANKVSSIDTSKYSASDAAYFAEVTARCAQKVADAGIY